MFDAQVWGFFLAAALLTLIPGSDTMLVIRSVLARGTHSGLITVLGICSGSFIHASLSALGLSLILVRSAAAYEVVKIAGACYLVFLGIQSLRQLWRKEAMVQTEPPVLFSKRTRVAFFEGLLNNLLNPKTALFYLAFLPQFIAADDPAFAKSMLLAGIHFVQGIVWLALVALFVGRLKLWLSHPRVKKTLEAAVGLVFIGFGLRLALERR
jgi:RhtB (resistance to homoserine/threonine) family protein